METKDKHILISLLNWRIYQDTFNCLQQLQRINYPSSSILIVDNHSQNDSVQRINGAFPGVVVIESPVNKGFAAGHKIAAEYAIKNNFELLWILNPDVILNENTLPALIEAYKRNGPAIYGSVSVKEYEPDIIEFGGAYEIKSKAVLQSPPPSHLRRRVGDEVLSLEYNIHKGASLSKLQQSSKDIQVGAVEGFSMLVPVDLIMKYGFMDTAFFMYGEETEYCLGLANKGIPSYIITKSVIVHKGEGSFQKSGGAAKVIAYYRSRNYRLIAKKYFGLTNNKILKNVGGIKALAGFFIKWIFAGNKFKREKALDYFHNLGILHALLGVKGKRVKPEKYCEINVN